MGYRESWTHRSTQACGWKYTLAMGPSPPTCSRAGMRYEVSSFIKTVGMRRHPLPVFCMDVESIMLRTVWLSIPSAEIRTTWWGLFIIGLINLKIMRWCIVQTEHYYAALVRWICGYKQGLVDSHVVVWGIILALASILRVLWGIILALSSVLRVVWSFILGLLCIQVDLRFLICLLLLYCEW